MAVTYRSGVVAEAQGKLLFQLRKSGGKFPAFLSPILNQLQELETVFYNLIAGRQLATATGWALDQLGQSVGERRLTVVTDDVYRGLIYARIAINTSEGTGRDVYDVIRLMGATAVQVRDVYPAAINVEYTGALPISGAQLRTALEQSTAPIEIDLIDYPDSAFMLAGELPGMGLDDGFLSAAY